MISRVVTGLKYVTHGKRSDIAGYTQAGKTGTAEKIINGVYSKEHNIASFVGFAPVSDPVFVLIVSIDDPERAFVPGVGPIHFWWILRGTGVSRDRASYLSVFGYYPG